MQSSGCTRSNGCNEGHCTKGLGAFSGPTFTGHRVVDLFGDRITYKEATTQIGEAIGIPELPYVQFSDADAVKGMMGMGLSKNMAESYAENVFRN